MQKSELTTEIGMQAKQFLQKTSLFASWPEQDLDEIIVHAHIVTLADGSVIFTPEEIGSKIYLLLKGSVEIFSPDKKTVLAEFVAGELFGEIALLTQKPQTAFAIAHKEVCLLAFPENGTPIETVFKDKPRMLAKLFRSLLIFTSQRTRAANTLIKENSPVVRELRNQVYNDKLTGLFNRTYLEETFAEFCKTPFALIMLKPDNFKYINDTFGHEVGDAALTFIAAHLKKVFAQDNIVARYEGNEFALVTHTHVQKAAAREFAQTIQQELQTLDLSHILKRNDVHLSISLGVILYPEYGKTIADIITVCAALPLAGRQRGGSLILFPEEL
ncbi:MAG: GGDEF domain-containing protein [Treponema sp.]